MLAADIGHMGLDHDLHDHDHDHPDHDHDAGIVSDAAGNEFFIDPAPVLDAADIVSAAPGISISAVPAVGGVPALNSKPGADQTLFLDFDGHVVEDTYWNDRNFGDAIHARPYSTDGNTAEFSAGELSRIEEIFRRVAEDFAPFDVNVSTVDPGVAAFAEGGTALRTIISDDIDAATGNRWFDSAGGVAYLNSWYWRSDTPVWVFENNLGNGNEKFVAEAISHEIGHAFGLQHDGGPGTGYYNGHGSGETGWASIMGVGYNQALSQWSAGEYSGANNQQDDIAILTNALGTEVDVVGDTIDDATELVLGDDGRFDVSGLIGTRDDVDVFSFETAGGPFAAAARPFDVGDGKSNLDLSLSLLDAAGQLIVASNPPNFITAALSVSLTAGTYYLSVDGVGTGDPLATGYTDYGSLGWYDLDGLFTPAGPGQGGNNDDGTLSLTSADIVSYGGGQDVSENSSVTGGVVNLGGNTWRQTALDYTVTDRTVLQFDFATTSIGEIHGIGLDTDSSISRNLTFQVAGTQRWGNRDQQYTGDGEFQTFSINVGEFYTGDFSSLFFVNDNDVAGGGNSNSRFRNIRLFESAEPLNTAPVAVDDTAEVRSGDSVTIDLVGNDFDDDGDELTIASVSGATSGSAEIIDGQLVYTAASDFVGTETLSYTIDDGRGLTATASVTIEVVAADDVLRLDLLGVDSYGGRQDVDDDATLFSGGTGILLQGNTWKSVPLSYTVTPDTVLQFEVATNGQGEILGIGLDNDNRLSSNQTFRLGGNQNWGINRTGGLVGDGQFRTVTIPVGDYYTGTFDRLVFANDHDVANPTAVSAYRNIRIFEPSTAAADAPATQSNADDAGSIDITSITSAPQLFDYLRDQIDQNDQIPDRVAARVNRLIDRLENRYDRLSPERRDRIDRMIAGRFAGRTDGGDANVATDLALAHWTLADAYRL